VSDLRRRSETIRAPVGDVEVPLEESPTTGYRWTVVDLPPEVEVLGDEFRSPSGQRVAGGSGTRVFRLRIAQPGTFTVTMHLGREWEPAPFEILTLLLEIAA
jgi:predicted secreted protein